MSFVKYVNRKILGSYPLLPAEVVFAPAWWHQHAGITFDKDFFYHPARRVEVERRMEEVLYKRWGQFGLGQDRDKELPVVGPIHLAAGFLVSEMFGCQVLYAEDAPPQVICAERGDLELHREEAFKSPAYKRFVKLLEVLERRYGFVTGDVNWGGVLNVAIDIRGQALFTDMFDRPEAVRAFFGEIAAVIETFTKRLQQKTGSSSISVNRTVRHFSRPIFLSGHCSHTMISFSDYEQFLIPFDVEWGQKYRPFGIHYCGRDPHRYAEWFARLPWLDFLDVGWGGDVIELRRHLPETFLNLRLSPVEILQQSVSEIEATIRRLVSQSANPELTGVCCINMDGQVSDEKITAIFETVQSLRRQAHLPQCYGPQ